MRQMTLTQSGASGVLFAGPISYPGTQCMDFVEIFNISLDSSTIFWLILVGVEFPLCIVVIIS